MTASSTFLLAIPGTQDTQELPREAVLEAMRRGEIGPDHWVWNPTLNDWKPASEIPELQMDPPERLHLVPKIVPQAKIPEATISTPQTVSTEYSRRIEPEKDFPFFKVIFLGLFLLIGGVIVGNFVMIDQPFSKNLSATPFGSMKAYAHLGGFVQADALVIHILPTKDLSADNFADFLAALSKSTPPSPFSVSSFKMVSLTSGWQGQYLFKGEDWNKLRQMEGSTSDERETFELTHIEEMDGKPLLSSPKGADPVLFSERRVKAWHSFVSTFLAKSS